MARNADTYGAIARKTASNFHMSYQWVVELPDLSAVGMGIERTIAGLPDVLRSILKTPMSPVEISERVYSVTSSHDTIETQQVSDKSRSWQRADQITPTSLSITVDEHEDNFTKEYFRAWKALIESPDGSMNVPSIYKRPVRIMRLTNDMRIVSKTTYEGCFPTEIQPVSYSYDQEDIVQYEVTLAFDRYYDTLQADAGGVVERAINTLQQIF